MKILLNIILVGAFVIHGVAMANCPGALPELTVTENLIAYLDTLFEQNYIKNEILYIEKLLQDIEHNKKLTSPFLRLGDSNNIIQTNTFHELTTHPEMNREQLKQWLLQKLDADKKIIEKKADSREQTINSYTQMQFHKINSGRFEGVHGKVSPGPFEIDTPFTLMDTLVTQYMWVQIMGVNPSFYKDEGTLDHPVESITWWSAAEFANRLSIKHNLKPVYDFSQIKAWEGSPEQGTYLPVDHNDSFKLMRINAESEDIYKAEGYRLPTMEEMTMVTSRFDNRDDAKDPMLNDRSIFDYGWFSENSNMSTHPVAERMPFVVDGHSFYDLYGNVSQWTHDQSSSMASIALVTKSSYVRAVEDGAASLIRSAENTRTRTNWIGFRLVRSLPKEKK